MARAHTRRRSDRAGVSSQSPTPVRARRQGAPARPRPRRSLLVMEARSRGFLGVRSGPHMPAYAHDVARGVCRRRGCGCPALTAVGCKWAFGAWCPYAVSSPVGRAPVADSLWRVAWAMAIFNASPHVPQAFLLMRRREVRAGRVHALPGGARRRRRRRSQRRRVRRNLELTKNPPVPCQGPLVRNPVS